MNTTVFAVESNHTDTSHSFMFSHQLLFMWLACYSQSWATLAESENKVRRAKN